MTAREVVVISQDMNEMEYCRPDHSTFQGGIMLGFGGLGDGSLHEGLCDPAVRQS